MNPSRPDSGCDALGQLIGGLNKKNPRDLLTLGRAVIGLVAMSGGEPDPRLLDTTPPYPSA